MMPTESLALGIPPDDEDRAKAKATGEELVKVLMRFEISGPEFEAAMRERERIIIQHGQLLRALNNLLDALPTSLPASLRYFAGDVLVTAVREAEALVTGIETKHGM